MKSTSLVKPYFRENLHRIFLGLSCLIIVDLLQLVIPRIIKTSVDILSEPDADMNRIAMKIGRAHV